MESIRKIALAPTPRLNLVEWADNYRYLSPEASSSPGKWKTSNVEAARGPMLAVTEPGVKKITVMGPTQLLKTELLNNIVGYFIHQDPRPMIVMQPTVGLAETWSRERLDKMLRDTPALQGRVKERRGRDADNRLLSKAFPGGQINIIGSNSPTEVASRPVSVVLCDEVDKYPASVGDEGDPIKLIEERTDTFWNALSVRVCSPTIKGRSRIEIEYELSDKREFHGRCPHCDELDELKWANVEYDKSDPEGTAAYVCSKCGTPWTEPERLQAISNGEYVATAPFTGHAGFHCNKLASPWQPVSVLVRKWIEAQGKPEMLKAFVNTQLAETWEEAGERPDDQRLYERRETYEQNKLPDGVVFLTCGADVQKDRIEAEIVGWTRDRRSYSIDYRVYMGETASADPWKKMDALLNESWATTSGQRVQIRVLAIDSGYNTQHVYEWARKQSSDRVRVTKGQDGLQSAFGTPTDVDKGRDGGRIRRALKLWPVGVSVLKSQLYGWLQLDKPEDGLPYPEGYCHFPQYDLEHFKRLTAEQLIKKTVNGRTVYRWIKTHERNEQLDCRVLAMVSASMFGIERLQPQEWDLLQGKVEKPKIKSEDKRTPDDTGGRTPVTSDTKDDFWARQNGKKKFW